MNYFKERNEKIVAYKDTATDIRESMDIMNAIVNVLRPTGI